MICREGIQNLGCEFGHEDVDAVRVPLKADDAAREAKGYHIAYISTDVELTPNLDETLPRHFIASYLIRSSESQSGIIGRLGTLCEDNDCFHAAYCKRQLLHFRHMILLAAS